MTVGFAKVSLMAEDQSLSQCLTLGAEAENDVPHRPNPANPRQHRPVILDLIQNPQGGGNTALQHRFMWYSVAKRIDDFT